MTRPYRLPRARFVVVNGEVINVPKKCKRTDKELYIDKVQAELALLRVRSLPQTRRAYSVPIRTYKCEFCGYYHLTSQELHNEGMRHSA